MKKAAEMARRSLEQNGQQVTFQKVDPEQVDWDGFSWLADKIQEDEAGTTISGEGWRVRLEW